MTKIKTLSGGGGSKGGGEFVQRPDNLRSTDRFEGLIGLGAGPWKGPVKGFQSIKMNGTPIEAPDGTSNFEDFEAIFADGDPAKFPQEVELRLGAGATPVSVGLAVTNPNGGAGTESPGDWVTQSIANTNADFLDLRFLVQQLYAQDKKGIRDTDAHLEIQMKPSGATQWINPQGDAVGAMTQNPDGIYEAGDFSRLILSNKFNENGFYDPYPTATGQAGYFRISGKTTSMYVYEVRILVPNTGEYANKGWDIRVRLRERDNLDADPNFEKRTIQWESIAAGFNTKHGTKEAWRGLAWLQLYGKASNQLNGVPDIEGEYDTLIVPVPPATVFDPEARTYTGAMWDGTWAQAFTRDPAWCINGILQNSLHGISSITPYARLNKWDALAASKWFSELVPDGNGGLEPRYSLDIAVNEVMKAKEFVQYMAGAVGAIAWEGNQGEWHMRVDKPEQPVDIFTIESIVGEFRYTHSDIDTRFNDITAVFRNKEFGYREDRVRVVDNAAIAKYGRKPTTITLVGCTGRQEALRRIIMRLRVLNNEIRTVTFTTNRRARLLERLDTILVADNDLNHVLDASNPESTGRIVAVAPNRTWIEVRDPLRLELGAAYTLQFSNPNAAYNPDTSTDPSGTEWRKPTLVAEIGVTNTSAQRGDVRRIHLASPLPANVADNANVALNSPALAALPKAYRVLDINESDGDGESMVVVAIEIDSGKWAASDAGLVETELDPRAASPTVPPPVMPTAGMFGLREYTTEFQKKQVLTVNWDRPATLFLLNYKVEYRYNGGPWVSVGDTTETYFELPDPQQGSYDFRIFTQDMRNALSVPLHGNYVVEEILAPLDLIAIADDGKITAGEKISVRERRASIMAEFPIWRDRAIAFGVEGSIRTNFQASYDALIGYLATLNINTNNTDNVVRADFISSFVGYTTARERVIEAISQIASQRANWSGVTGPGRPQDNADVTGNNIAAAIAGQGGLATRSNVGWVADIMGKPFALQDGAFNASGLIIGERLAYNDGLTVQALRPEEGGSNRTESRVAAAISGQGAFATINQVNADDTSRVSLPARLAPDPIYGNSFLRSDLIAWRGGDVLENWKPGEPGANRTETRVASAIAGQGSLATRSTVGWVSDVMGKPFALQDGAFNSSGLIIGERLAYNDGLTIQALRPEEGGSNRTESRVAAAISGQGSWATYNAFSPNAVVNPTFNLITDPGLRLRGKEWSLLSGWYVETTPAADVGFYVGNSSNDANMRVGRRVNIFANNHYVFSIMNGGASYSGTPILQLNWYDNSGNYVSQVTGAGTAPGLGYQRSQVTGLAPANAVFAECYLKSPGGFNSGFFIAFKPKLEIGTVASIWRDDNTSGALYSTGQDIDWLRPGEFGANVTETRVASAITGQGTLATRSNVGWAADVLGRPAELTDGRISVALRNDGSLQSGLWGGSASVPNVQLLEAGLTGKRIVRDPDFAQGMSIFVYNNSGGNALSLSRISDPSAPNGSGFIVRISYDGVGATTPGYGGYTHFLMHSNTSRPGFYAQGTKVVYVIRARIPAGRNIEFASNQTGNGGSSRWLTSRAGTGDWQTYLYEVTHGIGGILAQTGYFWIEGGPNTAFSWDVALSDCREIGSTDTPALDRLIDSNGNFRGDADLITNQGVAAAIAGQTAWATLAVNPNRVSRIDDNGFIQGNNVYLSGVDWLSNVWPAEANANRTETRVAAAIAGQAAWATLNAPVGRVSLLTDDGRMRLGVGNGLVNSDNSLWLTDANTITSQGVAAAITGQGTLATRNEITASVGSGMRFTDNLIPDNEYKDLTWWGVSGLPNFYFMNAPTAHWSMPRILEFTADRDFDAPSQFFTLEKGSTYRIRCRIWNNNTAAGWSGAFWPMLHIPSEAWFSLKHGYSINPDVADAANAIVANGDVVDQEFYFTPHSNAARQVQFRFKSTARGSQVAMQFHISKVQRLGRDLIRSETNLPYVTSDIQTNLGTASSFTGQGSLATRSNVGWAADIMGRPNFLTDTTVVDGAERVRASYIRNVGQESYLSERWPAEFGANVTETRVASAITGQGAWATTSVPISKVTQVRPNMFPYPYAPVDGRTPAQLGWQNATNGGILVGISTPYLDGTAYAFYRPNGGAAGDVFPFFDMSLPEGLPTSVGLSGYGGGAQFLPYLEFLNADRSAVLAVAGLNYNPVNDRWEVNGYTSPAGTAWLRIVVRGAFSASSSYQDIVWWGIKVERGPNATPISENSLVRLPAQSIEYNNGLQLNALRPGEFGANVTETRVASAIAGQGSLATRSNVGWVSDIMGRPNFLTNTMFADGDERINTWYVRNPNDGSYLAERWAEEGNANRTETRVASAIAGQSPWATSPIPTGRLSLINDNGRATNRRINSQIMASGILQLLDTNPITAFTTSGGVSTIQINAHTVYDDVGTLSFSPASISGLSHSTLYYVWEFNPNFEGGARSYVATTNRNDVTAFGRRFVGFVNTPAPDQPPVNGGGGGGGPIGGGGGFPGGEIP